ncbi:M13 family metallopeptidase [Roseateles cellulosilyticus]|uniref:M13 family metallopeptidase n=1 Tax=Pelomonas cellulosilytica TaxID=2906762 RepID=A0ABS8Y407_9BURK|nr:M13 family metallopeptidase [Pelomonas sp. P8]MCE4557841.1 M13 family metallopeptidase [Pelomonas sp. P8]
MPRFQRHRLALAATLLGLAAHATALDLSGLSKDVSPCDDFFTFVNGSWEAATVLPAGRGRIGSFDDLRQNNAAVLEKALTELADKPTLQTTPGLKLAAAYFASGMDEAAIEARGTSSLTPLLNRIDGLQRREDLPTLIALLARSGVAAPLGWNVGPDRKDTRRNLLSLSQSGLGLPDRDDYFRTDERTRTVSAAYRTYGRTLLAAAGRPVDDAGLDALMAFETRLADATRERVKLRDPNANYNPMTLADLAAAAPGLDWSGYVAVLTAGAKLPQRVNVQQPEFATRVAALAAETPLEVWRSYLTLRVLDATAARLPKAFANARFEYRDKTITGLQAPPPRSEDVIQQIGGNYGQEPLALALGELFVARAFSPEAQRRAVQLVEDIRGAMHDRIEKLEWMTPATKAKALDKLARMQPLIGAPDKWPRFEGLELTNTDYAGNWLKVALWHSDREMKDLDAPVERTRWRTSPHIVNAFAGGLNQITFPAGILQPPFFDAKADDAANYGGIGMVIGHEITHHFDDSGRNYDANGSLTDWWTPADAAGYKARADLVADRYGAISPLPGYNINGRLTLGENISDMSGLPIAYEGLLRALKRTGGADRKVDGYTPAQRFFLSNALVWRSKTRTEYLINQLRTDPHSPSRYRVLTPMSNSPYFAQAFSCKAGSAMVAKDPITVW